MPEPDSRLNRVEVSVCFVRRRNALLARGLFSGIYEDYYLHLLQHSLRVEPKPDRLLKDALAALTLHLASRPWREVSAWTFHFREPRLNLFVTGNSLGGNVVGRIFTEDVREMPCDLLHAQVTSPTQPLRQSSVQLDGCSILEAVETYYIQSEQRPARIFELQPEDYAMISAQPDCDMAWFDALDYEAVRQLAQTEELGRLETRRYAYDCGCTIDRVYPLLAPLAEDVLDDLFAGDASVSVQCPRCAARFEVRRSDLEDFLSRRSG
jgi:molecular chaperone Hsp33